MLSPAERGPEARAIVLRALLYALAITALVLWAPSEPHVFIYPGF
ncbi:MAG: hypothetical protein ACE5FG_04405 [Myxococcota bacterium]